MSWSLSQPVSLVVITGGEPLLQQARLLPVAQQLSAAGRRVEIETNGTIAPLEELTAVVSAFNVSPKLRSFAAAKDEHRRIDPAALGTLMTCGKAVFKFVVTGPGDLDEVAQLQAAHRLDPIWIMPEGTSAQATLAVMRAVADDVLARGWHLTPRLHVLLWGDVRGR